MSHDILKQGQDMVLYWSPDSLWCLSLLCWLVWLQHVEYVNDLVTSLLALPVWLRCVGEVFSFDGAQMWVELIFCCCSYQAVAGAPPLSRSLCQSQRQLPPGIDCCTNMQTDTQTNTRKDGNTHVRSYSTHKPTFTHTRAHTLSLSCIHSDSHNVNKYTLSHTSVTIHTHPIINTRRPAQTFRFHSIPLRFIYLH